MAKRLVRKTPWLFVFILLCGCGSQSANEQAISEALLEQLPGMWRVIDLSIVEQDPPPPDTAFDHRYLIEARVAPQKTLYSVVIEDVERTVIAPALSADKVYSLTGRVLARGSGADAYFRFRLDAAPWRDDIASAKARDLWPDKAIATDSDAFDAELVAQHERMDRLWKRLLDNADEQDRVRARLANLDDERAAGIASARQRLDALTAEQARSNTADWAAFMAARRAVADGGDRHAVDAAREALKAHRAERAEATKQAQQRLEALQAERSGTEHDLTIDNERTQRIMRLRLAAMADQEDRLAELESYADADQQRPPVDTSAFVAFCNKNGMSGNCSCLRDALLADDAITPDVLVLTAWFANKPADHGPDDSVAHLLRRARAAHLRPANALYAPQSIAPRLQRAVVSAAQRCEAS